MRIIFPYDKGLTRVEMGLITVNKNSVHHWHLIGCGYPDTYFKRR